jgi:hypothetical protein
MSKNFFKSNSERNLWIKLNAERIMYSNHIINPALNEDIGGVDEIDTPMYISSNQLEYDENEHDVPRFSFEELLLLSPNDLLKLANERHGIKTQEFSDMNEQQTK